MTTKPKAKKNDQRTAEANHERLVRECNRLKTEVRDLREVVGEFDERIQYHRKLAVSIAISGDLDERVRRCTMLELRGLANRLREHAENEAREYVVSTGSKDKLPSGIIVALRSSDVIKQMAEEHGGMKLDIPVQ